MLQERFLDACDETFHALARMPYIGSEREFTNPALHGVRMWRVKGFEKYLIFYRPLEDGVEILHVIHGARDYKTLFDSDVDDDSDA